MKLEGMETRGGGGSKPVPLPRRINQNLIESTNSNPFTPNSNSESWTGGGGGDVNCNPCTPPTPPTPATNKPVPFPRKLIQRLTTKTSSNSEVQQTSSSTTDAKEESEEDKDTLDYDSIPGPSPSATPKDPKRGTINIFKLANQLQDPFDTEFEKSIGEAEVVASEFSSPRSSGDVAVAVAGDGGLSAISFSSPFSELDEKTRRRISTLSSISSSTTTTTGSSDESEHYMEPPPARPVSSELAGALSARRKEAPIRSSTSRNSNFPLPPFEEELSNVDEFDFKEKKPLGKVLSCPTASVSNTMEDSMYEPISSYSSSDSGSITGINLMSNTPKTSATAPLTLGSFGSDTLIPPNKNFSDAKRTTVPNVEKLYREAESSISSSKKEKNGQSRFDATAFDISDLFSKHSKKPTTSGVDSDLKRRSFASSTETTDSFGSFDRNVKVELRRSSSNRSSAGSERHSSCKKPHEYDDVAIEDGSVILLDNINAQSSSSDTTNNNSISSLTSRNSVIAEFDPLLTPEPVHLRQQRIDITVNETSNDLSKSPPLNLNDEEQHRYEFIDTDPEEGDRNSNSTVDNNSFEDDGSMSTRSMDFNHMPLPKHSSLDNPAYFSGDRLGMSRLSEGISIEDDPSSTNDRYEPVGSPPTSRGVDFVSNSNTSYSPQLPPKPERNLRAPPNVSVLDRPDRGMGMSSENEGSASLVNQSSFFRRFSSKFRLNSIKEERDSEKKDLGGGPTCKKCLMEHQEHGRCKFTPSCRPNVLYSSNLYKSAGIGRKDFVKKRVVLAKGKLAFYNDKSEVISEVPLEKMTVISKRDDYRINPNLPNLKYFELGLVNWKTTSMILAGSADAERGTWMQKYIEVHTGTIPPSVLSNFDRGGWCFIKETVTSSWRPSWLILKERSLFYAYHNSEEYYEMDLRKARSIVLSQKEEEHRCPFVDNQEVLTLDLICKILYVQTESGKVTAGWEKAIQAAANFNGTTFQEMQLTLDNVPVVVDKCIDFLYAHGTLAEGIYRQSGSNTRITQLLSEFQKDAWAVQISHKDFSAHDVAGTLKRFFRTLPEPLVTSSIYDSWIKAASMMKKQAKLDEYTRLLESLPQINYNIMKKLICHLYAVHELHEKNLMPLINLAPIWGPTLMNVDTSSVAQSYETACAECEVVKDLIENYYNLFRVEAQEIAREKKMQDALENFHLGSCRRKHSGDMKIWIYLWDKDETSAINVTLTPQSTAHGIVHQICSKSQISNVENLSLHEVICGKALERPLHPSEKVIESVLRWSIWDIEERKNNFLILKKNIIYPPLVHYAKEAGVVSGELKYADSKSKSFRKYTFHLSQHSLKYSKDPKFTTELGCWKIEDIVWYMGCEPKRSPPTKWTFTLVKRNYPFKRGKEEPFFGSVISCPCEEELNKWLGAMVVSEHPEGLYPSVIV